jgi:hypothetical protein
MHLWIISWNGHYMTNSHNNLQYPFNRLASIRRRYTSFEFFKQDPSQTIHVAYNNDKFNL